MGAFVPVDHYAVLATARIPVARCEEKSKKKRKKEIPNVTVTRDHRKAWGVPSDADVIARIFQSDGYARWAFDLGWASGFRTAAGTDWRVDAAERMIKRGRLVLLRWAMRYGGLRCEMANLRAFAAQQGHVAALRILCNRTRYLCWARQSHHLAPIAAYHGRIDILDFLRVQGAIDPKVSLRKAAHKGGAEMVHDWLDTHNIR